MVDDEPLVLRGYQRMLFDLSGQLEMDFADSGTTALARHEAEGFDVIVSDMRMPQMNGLELLQRLAQRSPATARILLTGYSDQNISIRFTAAVQHCLHKPCDSDHLIGTLLRLLPLQRAALDPAPAALAGAAAAFAGLLPCDMVEPKESHSIRIGDDAGKGTARHPAAHVPTGHRRRAIARTAQRV